MLQQMVVVGIGHQLEEDDAVVKQVAAHSCGEPARNACSADCSCSCGSAAAQASTPSSCMGHEWAHSGPCRTSRTRTSRRRRRHYRGRDVVAEQEDAVAE